MPGISLISQLVAADKASRQTVIEVAEKVSQYTKQDEPGVTGHAICIPGNEADEKSLWIIEDFASQEAYDSHMASKPVVDALAYFDANPTLFGGPPTIETSEIVAAFTRPDVVGFADPLIIYASIEYKDGKRAEALEGWKRVASETEKNEPETLSYSCQKNKDHPETIKIVEVYPSLKYFKEVHALSNAVKENKAKYGDEIRVSMKHAVLKIVAGYLGKGNGISNV